MKRQRRLRRHRRIVLEVFDRDIEWPAPRKDPDRQPVHPDRIPDTPDGPFTHWLRTPEDGDD